MSDESGGAGAVEPVDVAFAQAAERLYAVPLSEFMATRAALVTEARAAKDRPLAMRIGKLRKPTAVAGLVNQVVRAHPELIERVRSVGAQLRAAQVNLHGTAISALRPTRDAVLADISDAAEAVARAGGAILTPAAREEIRDTVIAALASEVATEAVASGALTRTLAYSGFGEIDLDDAVVAGFRRPPPTPGQPPMAPQAESAEEQRPGDGAGLRAAEPSAAEPSAAEPSAADLADSPNSSAHDVRPRDGAGPSASEPSAAEPSASEPSASERQLGPDPAHAPGARANDPLAALARGLTAPPPDAGDAADPEALIEAAAQAYAQAAGRVAQTKSVVAQTSQELDAAKARADDLRAQLAATEAELADLFARDAQAREAVTRAVHDRQAAAEVLARREAGR